MVNNYWHVAGKKPEKLSLAGGEWWIENSNLPR
jgi:hypothetical protein